MHQIKGVNADRNLDFMELYVLSGPVREFLERLESVSPSVDRNNLGIDNK